MPTNINDLNTWVILLGSGGLSALGAFLITFLRQRAEREDQRSGQRFARERTVIGDYQKLIEEKEHDFDADRAAWKSERVAMAAEIADYRRRLQRDMVDMEGMRFRIETQEKDLATLGSTGLRQFIGERYDPVVFADSDGNICWANEPASLFLRIPLKDLLLMNVEVMIPKSLLPLHRQGMARIKAKATMERGQISERFFRARTLVSDGSEIPTDISVVTFAVSGVVMCRAQFRRRYERPEVDEPTLIPVYYPIKEKPVDFQPDQSPIPAVTTAPLKPMMPPETSNTPEPIEMPNVPKNL